MMRKRIAGKIAMMRDYPTGRYTRALLITKKRAKLKSKARWKFTTSGLIHDKEGVEKKE